VSERPPAATLNEETRQPQPRQRATKADLVPTLTIVGHPDLRRVGERCSLVRLMLGERAALSRVRPDFIAASGDAKRPLADPYLSRKPIWLSSTARGIQVDTTEVPGSVRIEGELAKDSVTLDSSRLELGVLLELSERVSFLLHAVQPKPFVAARGLIGASEALRRVQLDIDSAASHARPVIVLGESGSGKELVCRAVHDQSPRASGPFVAVNMAAIPESTAVAELFGHVKGAFTGATSASLGLFRKAHGGTLFMDEIGETSSEVQAMLLRVLETGEVRPLGGDPVQVDVRLVAATDADLAQRQASGDFKLPLWHRLSGAEIRIPALRERRDDIARLWVHFVREALGAAADEWVSERLEDPTVTTESTALLLGYRWPGNVRELRHLAARFAEELRREGSAPAADALRRRLAGGAAGLPRAPVAHETSEAAAPAEDTPAPGERTPPDQIDDAILTAALRDNQWKIGATARQLGISRTTLYRLIDQCATLRKARDVPPDEVIACQKRCNDDLELMAAELRVSERALRLRMKDLGLR